MEICSLEGGVQMTETLGGAVKEIYKKKKKKYEAINKQ